MAHNNATLASSKTDRDRLLHLIAQHYLATGETLSIKQIIAILLDQYIAPNN